MRAGERARVTEAGRAAEGGLRGRAGFRPDRPVHEKLTLAHPGTKQSPRWNHRAGPPSARFDLQLREDDLPQVLRSSPAACHQLPQALVRVRPPFFEISLVSRPISVIFRFFERSKSADSPPVATGYYDLSHSSQLRPKKKLSEYSVSMVVVDVSNDVPRLWDEKRLADPFLPPLQSKRLAPGVHTSTLSTRRGRCNGILVSRLEISRSLRLGFLGSGGKEGESCCGVFGRRVGLAEPACWIVLLLHASCEGRRRLACSRRVEVRQVAALGFRTGFFSLACVRCPGLSS